jgi:site-specific DNA-methyltransferase (adenine-specific)
VRKTKETAYQLTRHHLVHILREEAQSNSVHSMTIGDYTDAIICGDAESTVRALPSESVNAIITSPPYYQQRDYGAGLQIGNESSPEAYAQKLAGVFRECFRVLAKDGTLWLNLGDKYKEGRLLGMPWRVVFALESLGWILRSDIIWHKTNAMPASVKNRPTTDHEYVFMFSRSPDYFYNADAIREPHVTFTEKSRMRGGRGHFGKRGGTPEQGKNGGNPNLHNGRWDQAFHPLGRNKRTVWQIPLSKFPEAHFAVFPEKLVETCVMAATKPNGLVLDPFAGSGTVAIVAQQLGRHFVGIDCSEKYCALAKKRLEKSQLAFGLA